MGPKPLAGLFLILACVCSFFSAAAADLEHCTICGKALGTTAYRITDKVTHEKLVICDRCITRSEVCYLCSLPIGENPTKLSDGRFLCARDAKTAILDETTAKATCAEVRDRLDRELSRFLSLPATNVTFSLVDRVDFYRNPA